MLGRGLRLEFGVWSLEFGVTKNLDAPWGIWWVPTQIINQQTFLRNVS